MELLLQQSRIEYSSQYLAIRLRPQSIRRRRARGEKRVKDSAMTESVLDSG
jgi:hypothetical protein